jgi:hypothetical protein
MQKNRIFTILILLLALCGGCTGYNYYDPYYYGTKHDRELNRKLDNINRELKQQAFDNSMDRLDHDLGRIRNWDY